MKIGIDLGGSHIGVGIIDEDKIIDTKQKNFTDEDKQDIKKVIIESSISMIKNLLDDNKIMKSQIELIGIASPGIISNGNIIKASNLGLVNFDLCEVLQNKMSMKVQLRNDAKCAALAEKKYGVLKHYCDAVFVGIGTGIGGAVFMRRKSFETQEK